MCKTRGVSASRQEPKACLSSPTTPRPTRAAVHRHPPHASSRHPRPAAIGLPCRRGRRAAVRRQTVGRLSPTTHHPLPAAANSCAWATSTPIICLARGALYGERQLWVGGGPERGVARALGFRPNPHSHMAWCWEASPDVACAKNESALSRVLWRRRHRHPLISEAPSSPPAESWDPRESGQPSLHTSSTTDQLQPHPGTNSPQHDRSHSRQNNTSGSQTKMRAVCDP